jgi:beta-glucosidase/6-phospho-beta-glucosidase/beta-galactosidase
MRLELDLDFKKHFDEKDFFFGVANAPYLCEGGYNYPDGMKNSYGVLELSDKIQRSKETIRFWTNYEEQIRLAASLGLNAFRMGVDWSRIQPSTSQEPHDSPPWDKTALDHYADIIEMVINHDMQPIITLHHFTHPGWVPLDMWLSDEGPTMLINYEQRVVDEINTRLKARGSDIMRHFLVYNEPNLIPLIYHHSGLFPIQEQGDKYLLPAYDTMLSHYVKAYDKIYDLFEEKGWGEPHVGFTIANLCAYEMDKQLDDLVRLRTWGVTREDAPAKIAECREAWLKHLDPLARSQHTDEQYTRYLDMIKMTSERLAPEKFVKTLDALYASPRTKKLDYLSVNVYDPFGMPRNGDDQMGTPWDEFPMDGEVYRTFILATNDFNDEGLPVYMGENSLANLQPIGEKAKPRPDGWTRERYLKTYLMEMIRCMKEGVPIKGYLYWSLVDDFEWQAGFPPRLGLYNYDYVNHKIRDTDGFGEPSGEIYKHLVASLRSGEKSKVQMAFSRKFKLR